MGDCDCTYDFREIKPFVEKLDEGYEFVMGSRFKGYIEPGAMPALHRYFGAPLTTFILNLIYKSRYSDIHCGMRALTRRAWDRMGLECGSWEYASEMTLKAAVLELRRTEVPIRFYKGPEGRLSHHKRRGWLSPWMAGWSNLKAMFLYRPQFFLKIPGVFVLLLGLILLALSLEGGQSLGPIDLSLHSSLLAMTLVIFGHGALQLAVVAKVFHNFEPAATQRLERLFSYDRGLLASLILGLVGLAFFVYFIVGYVATDYRLATFSRSAVIGLVCLMLAFQQFSFTLILNMLVESRKNRERIQRPE